MKPTITIHSSTDSIITDFPILYFKKSYLKSQNHDLSFCYESDTLFIPLVVQNSSAISIPRSPFGSFLAKSPVDEDEFSSFLHELVEDLKAKGAESLTVVHPAAIYRQFVSESRLEEVGFKKNYSDINQHIELTPDWQASIHKMQSRKLASLQSDGFAFRQIAEEEMETVHKFIAACRQVQGLTINISLDVLSELAATTLAYEFYGVFREDKLSAVCITARVSPEVVYYFLPATSPTFRSHSPMVLLIAGMVEHFQSQGVKYFDMGISSIEGKPQESLKIFKERMGAEETLKTTWTLQL